MVSSGRPCRQGLAAASAKLLGFGVGQGGDLTVWKPRCKSSSLLPAAIQEHRRQHSRHQESMGLVNHMRRCVKRPGGTLPSKKSFWISVPRPRHRLAAFRRMESPLGRKCHGGQPAEKGGGVHVQLGLIKRR